MFSTRQTCACWPVTHLSRPPTSNIHKYTLYAALCTNVLQLSCPATGVRVSCALPAGLFCPANSPRLPVANTISASVYTKVKGGRMGGLACSNGSTCPSLGSVNTMNCKSSFRYLQMQRLLQLLFGYTQ